jgi:hypothetical protein
MCQNILIWLKREEDLHTRNTSHGAVNTKLATKGVPKYICISVAKILFMCDSVLSSFWGLSGWKYQVLINTLRRREIEQRSLLHLCSSLRLTLEKMWYNYYYHHHHQTILHFIFSLTQSVRLHSLHIRLYSTTAPSENVSRKSAGLNATNIIKLLLRHILP